MKQRLRAKVWWPGIDKEVERVCRTCHGCQLVAQPSKLEPMRWSLPNLLLLRRLCPCCLKCLSLMVSNLSVKADNCLQFVSDHFRKYLEKNGIEHRRATPLWPQANGEIERQNRSILKRLPIAQAEVETGNLRWMTS